MITFTNIWILLLIPLPLFIRWLPQAKSEKNSALSVPFFSRIKPILDTKQTLTSYPKWQLLLGLLLWGLLLISAAGPTWLGEPLHLPQTGRDIMLAVDLSGSMRLPDMTLNNQPVDRLAVIKDIASQFIKQRIGDRIGLVVFGSRAYLQTPLTFDRQTVAAMLNDTSIGLAGEQTAIGDAIGLGIKRLLHFPKDNRVLILVTDGASNTGAVSPIDAAKLAQTEHIKIYTIGLGSDQMEIPGIFGTQIVNPSQDLDEHTLREIARITGGLFFRAKDSEALGKIYQELSKIEPVVSDSQVFRPMTPLFGYPLILAILISVLWALYFCYRN